ncbi:cysteine desulfurase family protein [Tessaracoccus sp. OH4464_COT-324]|uniref:cysteine desulfurase family protein n=1 Tax=Tessaracoccus sp. OH4464_COT-324 TaxID=2491059 RepID=UPI000F6413FC|nr:cysteine desulfurase family protein [Tessaracoccus sp. OH4464_COT-324]RRD47908.1 cysteine desulfurase [Tessaracoccus sp. OH4464_COT-324]
MSSYVDHAATSPIRPEALAALHEGAQLVGNPAALHRAGQRARARLEEAREELAAAIDCRPPEVIFTSGGSEADSIAVLGGWRASARPRALISAIEHPAVKESVRHGAELLPVTQEGTVDLGIAEELLDERVGLVSVQVVNNETGIIQPVPQLLDLSGRHGCWLHTDAVQAFGHLPLSFAQLGVDLMSLSAHKIGGPIGVGALIAKTGVELTPVGLGGGQERGVRSGTQSVALAAGFAAAATAMVEQRAAERARLSQLNLRVRERLAGLGARLTSEAQKTTPHIVHASFPGTRANDLLVLLDQRGVFASVGSACRAGVHQPSEVLLAMGATAAEAASCLRFSFGWNTTEEEVERLCSQIGPALELARSAF